jgi:protein-S-isoprenylcysteine O-methyltransferase Ste14
MRTLYLLVVQALWVAWVIYWAVAAANVKSTQRREPLWSRLLHFIPMLLAAALVALPSIPGAPVLSWRFVAGSDFAHWGGCLLLGVGLGFSVWARMHLGRNWSGRIAVKENHELIQTGPYAVVRHPIYTGLLLAIIGTALALGEWRGLVAVVLMLVSYWRKLTVEERWMLNAFGDRYRHYRAQTSALIPYLL